MLLNLYLFTSVQSKAFILPFCIYEPLAHEATSPPPTFFSLHNYVHGLPFSPQRALCMMDSVDSCRLPAPPPPPNYHRVGVCVVILTVLVQIKKSFI